MRIEIVESTICVQYKDGTARIFNGDSFRVEEHHYLIEKRDKIIAVIERENVYEIYVN